MGRKNELLSCRFFHHHTIADPEELKLRHLQGIISLFRQAPLIWLFWVIGLLSIQLCYMFTFYFHPNLSYEGRQPVSRSSS